MCSLAIDILDALIKQFENYPTNLSDDDYHGILKNHDDTKGTKQCICGDKLVKFEDALQIYGMDIICDICDYRGQKGDAFWHCERDQVIEHPHGYDICDACMMYQDDELFAISNKHHS